VKATHGCQSLRLVYFAKTKSISSPTRRSELASFALTSAHVGCDFDWRLSMCLFDSTDSVKHEFTDRRSQSVRQPQFDAKMRHWTYDWDSEKAASNLRRHGVSFTEATSVIGFTTPGSTSLGYPPWE